MTTSLLVLLMFGYDIVKRLIRDTYFRAIGTAVLLMLVVGTLFFWLHEGRSFVKAFAYSSLTMAMNSPYGVDWGPTTAFGVIFQIFYVYLSVGVFLLFGLEAGKTMVQSYEDTSKKVAVRKATRRAKKQANKQVEWGASGA